MTLNKKQEFFILQENVKKNLKLSFVYDLEAQTQNIVYYTNPSVYIIHAFQIQNELPAPALILSSCSSFEKKTTFVDIYGRFNKSWKVSKELQLTKPNWEILFAVYLLFKQIFEFYNNHNGLALSQSLHSAFNFNPNDWKKEVETYAETISQAKTKLGGKQKEIFTPELNVLYQSNCCFYLEPYSNLLDSIYLTDVTSNLSKNLALCALLENQFREL